MLKLLPIIAEETKERVLEEVLQDVNSWRKKMIHYIKEENPEINAGIIEAVNTTSLDPKAVALGAYLVYQLLEEADKEEKSAIDNLLE